MTRSDLRLAGVELYFDDLDAARRFYQDVLGLPVTSQDSERFAQFDIGNRFLCLEKKGVEGYPSRDKAVLFLETADLEATLEGIGRKRIVRSEPASGDRPAWAVLHDPEGHNLLLLQKK